MQVFEKAFIGSLELKNRMIASPVTPNYATAEGFVTEATLEFYGARARGGVGMVITEGTYVHPTGKGYTHQLGIYTPAQRNGLARLAEIIHQGGAKAAVQLHHAGRRTQSEITGFSPLSSSDIGCYSKALPPKALTTSQVERLIEAHAQAALLAKQAGFDGVDIHGAHGYLIPSFLSPLTNQREDRFGGSTAEERSRFAVELIKAIREAVGKDFAVTIKLSADDFVPGGCTVRDMQIIASLLEKTGIDGITVSAGTVGGEVPFDPEWPQHLMRTLPMGTPHRAFLHLAAKIHEAVSVPIIAVGKIHNIADVQQVLQLGQADFVALGRSLIADPDWPRKVQEGRENEIRPCISCNQGCFDRLAVQDTVLCTVNPQIGRPPFKLESSDTKKRILVIGGGAAGMQAAATAAARGHQVVLAEQSNELGGQMLLAKAPPDRGDISLLIDYLKGNLKKRGVEVRLSEKVTAETVAKVAPDVVVIATGGVPMIPKTLNNDRTISAWELLQQSEIKTARYLIVGGGLVGCETADLLSENPENKVVIVEMMSEIARDAGSDIKNFMMSKFSSRGVDVRCNTRLKEISNGRAVLVKGEDKESEIDYDVLVIAVGTRSDHELADCIALSGCEIYVAGDCIRPRRILDAIADGDRIGRLIR